VLYLDVKNRLIEVETLFEGSLSASPVYPREVLRAVLAHQAASVILVHNHPSGDAEPSREDYAITRRLVHALAPVNVTVHEHLIIGNNCHHSFAETGVMRTLHQEVRDAESAFMREWGPR
jgi:DNA repair protein RadC